MSFVVHRVTKSAARYTDAGGREKCGYCRFFVPPRSCGKVIGPVSPMGWCKHFSRQMVSQSGGGSTPVGGGPPGMTLSLDFMSSGNMPSGVTFTRASTATYTDSTGTIQTAATNAPRWEARGLLIEEARTNLLFPSVPGTGGWLTQGAATFGSAGGSVVLPDGTSSTTSLLAANSTAVDNRDILRNPGPAATGNTTYTVSAFVKSSAGSNAYIQVNGDGACVGYYNLTAGTAVVGQDLGVGATNKSVAITPLVNGWFRISMTFTSGPATTSLLFFIGLCSIVSTSGDNRTTAGVIGQGLYVWGTQIEQGSLSSHIATVGAAVTRAFDNCFIASADMAPWFASSGGTWFAEFIDNTPLGATSPRVIGIHGASGVAPLWANNSGFFISSGGGDINTINTVVPGAVSKGVSTQGGGAGKICLNGGGIGTGAQTGFATLATTGTGILGANPGVVNETMTGYIRRVQYWPRVLSDAEMQQVTT